MIRYGSEKEQAEIEAAYDRYVLHCFQAELSQRDFFAEMVFDCPRLVSDVCGWECKLNRYFIGIRETDRYTSMVMSRLAILRSGQFDFSNVTIEQKVGEVGYRYAFSLDKSFPRRVKI